MKFQDLNLNNFVLEAIKAMKFVDPTDIQKQMLPLILKGQNIIVSANTGTGKTYGYILGIIAKIDVTVNKTQAVIIVPTRELASQIYNICQKFVKFNPQLKVVNLIGGKDLESQKQKFNSIQAHIVVGTPVRIKTLVDEKVFAFTTSKMVVLDEVDMIFDLDFNQEVNFLLSKMSPKTQFMVFSATINQELQVFLKKFFSNAVLIDLTDYAIQTNIKHFLVKTRHRNRLQTLNELLKTINPFLCLIFVNKKEEIKPVLDLLQKQNIKVGEIHSNLPSRARVKMLKRINNLEFNYVICSDIAARGIDLLGVSHVISLHVPYDLSYFFHRAGRTGRGKYSGENYLFYDSDDEDKINYLIKKGIHFKIWNEKHKVANRRRGLEKSEAETNDLRKVLTKYHNQSIKPGYKKQRKEDMRKVIQKYRKKKIKKK